MALPIALVTFLIVAGISVLPFLLARSSNREKLVRRRLESIEKAQRRGTVTLETKLLRDELLSDVRPLHWLLLRWSWSSWLRERICQAGMQIRPGKLLLISGVVGLSAYLIVRKVSLSYALGSAAGVAGLLLPLAVVMFKRMRRMREFERNFPEAIDLLGRAVRAGHAFTTGMEMIGKELPPPVSDEFRVTFEEQNFGLPLKDAFLNLTERVPLIDVQFFATALLIQKETGGNLAEILDNLSRVIRERFKILGEVRIRTAQGRMTAGILMALPPTMMVLLGALNPAYTRLLFTDQWGTYMVLTALILQAVGSAMLWKIVHIEV